MMTPLLPKWAVERYYAMVLGGARHFLRIPSLENLPVQASSENREVTIPSPQALKNCAACKLASKRVRVCLENEWTPSDVFVLCDEPSPLHDGALGEHDPLFSFEGGSTQVIHNLLRKLNISPRPHRSFALKCATSEYADFSSRKICAERNLLAELLVVQPKFVLIFGTRALLSFLYAVRQAYHAQLVQVNVDSETCLGKENNQHLDKLQQDLLETNALTVLFNWGKVQILGFPSAAELTQHPEWRSDVWQRLRFLVRN